MIQILSSKGTANEDFLPERNFCSGYHNSNTIVNNFLLDNQLISVHKRRHLYFASISSQIFSYIRDLRACALMKLITLTTSLSILFNSGHIFRLASKLSIEIFSNTWYDNQKNYFISMFYFIYLSHNNCMWQIKLNKANEIKLLAHDKRFWIFTTHYVPLSQ